MGEEPELFYILGPVLTLAWVAQVSHGPAPPAWWRAGGGVEGGTSAFLHLGLGPSHTLAWLMSARDAAFYSI